MMRVTVIVTRVLRCCTFDCLVISRTSKCWRTVLIKGLVNDVDGGCVCAEMRSRVVDDVVLPPSPADQLRHLSSGRSVHVHGLPSCLPSDRRQAPSTRTTSEQIALHEATTSMGVYRHSGTGSTSGQQPALAVVRPTVSYDTKSRLSRVRDESESSHHQHQKTTHL